MWREIDYERIISAFWFLLIKSKMALLNTSMWCNNQSIFFFLLGLTFISKIIKWFAFILTLITTINFIT